MDAVRLIEPEFLSAVGADSSGGLCGRQTPRAAVAQPSLVYACRICDVCRERVLGGEAVKIDVIVRRCNFAITVPVSKLISRVLVLVALEVEGAVVADAWGQRKLGWAWTQAYDGVGQHGEGVPVKDTLGSMVMETNPGRPG